MILRMLAQKEKRGDITVEIYKFASKSGASVSGKCDVMNCKCEEVYDVYVYSADACGYCGISRGHFCKDHINRIFSVEVKE